MQNPNDDEMTYYPDLNDQEEHEKNEIDRDNALEHDVPLDDSENDEIPDNDEEE